MQESATTRSIFGDTSCARTKVCWPASTHLSWPHFVKTQKERRQRQENKNKKESGRENRVQYTTAPAMRFFWRRSFFTSMSKRESVLSYPVRESQTSKREKWGKKLVSKKRVLGPEIELRGKTVFLILVCTFTYCFQNLDSTGRTGLTGNRPAEPVRVRHKNSKKKNK